RGPRLHVAASKIVGAILYKLKTGCQWRLLPVKELLGEGSLGWRQCFTIFNAGQRTAASGGYG
ncbi:transposase, partial [Pontibacter sp. HSC-14F20]|nr:transposase [Pontibacter sp. HSC-14F20]